MSRVKLLEPEFGADGIDPLFSFSFLSRISFTVGRLSEKNNLDTGDVICIICISHRREKTRGGGSTR